MNDSSHTNSDQEHDRCRNTVRAIRGGRQGGPRVHRAAGARPAENRRLDPRLQPIPEVPEPEPVEEPAQPAQPEQSRAAIPTDIEEKHDAEPQETPPDGGENNQNSSNSSSRERIKDSSADFDKQLKHGRDTRTRDQRVRGPVELSGDEDTGWAPSDFRTLLRQLHDKDELKVRAALRRLHMRWYHAGIQQMERLLSLVGVPSTAMQLIPSIVDTCRICRTWAPRAPDTRIATRTTIRFNQCVQCDLLFYSDELDQRLMSFLLSYIWSMSALDGMQP